VAGYAFVLSAPASEAPVIGASGAIAGNIGAYLLLHPRAKIWVLIFLRIPIRLRAIWVIGFWIVFQIGSALASSGEDEIAWWAHIGGVVAGMVLVLFMRQKGVPLFAPPPNEPTPRVAAAESAPESPPLPPTEPPTGPWG
jgi:membrane associated rhomboid family serine protease